MNVISFSPITCSTGVQTDLTSTSNFLHVLTELFRYVVDNIDQLSLPFFKFYLELLLLCVLLASRLVELSLEPLDILLSFLILLHDMRVVSDRVNLVLRLIKYILNALKIFGKIILIEAFVPLFFGGNCLSCLEQLLENLLLLVVVSISLLVLIGEFCCLGLLVLELITKSCVKLCKGRELLTMSKLENSKKRKKRMNQS